MASGWGPPIAAILGLWLVIGVACLPVLASARVRDWLRTFPIAHPFVSYWLLVGVAVLGQAIVFLGGIVIAGGIAGHAAIVWALSVAAGYPLVLGLVGIVTATVRGWSSDTGRVDVRIVLALVAGWYAVVAVVLVLLVAFVLFVLYFPG